MLLHNPYYHHPQTAAKLAADDVFYYINHNKTWRELLAQGKMLGVLVVEPAGCARVHNINNIYYIAAYSGVVNGLVDDSQFFVPPIYDLQNPDDFYLQKDAAITEINQRLSELEQTLPKDKQQEKILRKQCNELKIQRKEMSIGLQREIFSHFSFLNHCGQYRNIIDLFADAKRGLPPGGSGECAAPRLLQYAFANHLKPIELAEFWYGFSPRNIQRIHGQFYPSCIEKCSPILTYMLGQCVTPPAQESTANKPLQILFEDPHIIAVLKPKELLSVPPKDVSEPNLEALLHELYPNVKGPMLVHRLDQATSGVMLAAKDAETHKLLQQQFEEKTIHKRYVATVRGKIRSLCGIISLPLMVNPCDRPRQVVDWQFGKPAVTFYQVIDQDETTTTLALYPQTGRTHQLRVHCASIFGLDAPILGDSLYDIESEAAPTDDKRLSAGDGELQAAGNSSSNAATPLQLHAESITFMHPYTHEELSITAPLKP